MLLASPGGKVQRFQLKQRHLIAVVGTWAAAMALFFALGFALR